MQHLTKSKMPVLNKQCAHQPHSMTILRTALLFCTLLQPILTEGQTAKHEPEFLSPLKNHSDIVQGRDIYFTCTVNHLSNYKVAWIKRNGNKAILTNHTHVVVHNPRLSVTYDGHNTWQLHISNVQINDSGIYMCQINSDPLKSLTGYLQVVVPPKIISVYDVHGTIEGGTVTLQCPATGVPKPTIVWKREGEQNIMLQQEDGLEKKEVSSFKGEILVLHNVHRTDMGVYLCNADNGVPPAVNHRYIVKVHFHPVVRVPNQLVAPLGGDILIPCYVETNFPNMIHWTLENGIKLFPSKKYVMEMTAVNDYSLLMKLTIRNLKKEDFRGYVCTTSYDSLGKAEGVVQLQDTKTVKSKSTVRRPVYFYWLCCVLSIHIFKISFL